MIAIVDYGMGNLHSLKKALDALGAESLVTDSPDTALGADKLILPGVGAFPDAMGRLTQTNLGDAVRAFAKEGKPVLGICLGMQLLFSYSDEYARTAGLGLLDGGVTYIKADGKIPHMGWNTVEVNKPIPLLAGADGRYFYFVHSFCAQDAGADWAAGVTEYGYRFCSVAARDNVMGTQFHPEKSGRDGLALLENFTRL